VARSVGSGGAGVRFAPLSRAPFEFDERRAVEQEAVVHQLPVPHLRHSAAGALFAGIVSVSHMSTALAGQGQPAFACRFSGSTEEPAGLIVLTLAGERAGASPGSRLRLSAGNRPLVLDSRHAYWQTSM
jgi:hypothetical protein